MEPSRGRASARSLTSSVLVATAVTPCFVRAKETPTAGEGIRPQANLKGDFASPARTQKDSTRDLKD
jgi:hypothetical protein